MAAGTQYQMRVDGLACPYCAYGIEKKLSAIDGVEKIDVDLENGLVIVNVVDGFKLSDEQMTQLSTTPVSPTAARQRRRFDC